jgi:hypothetical protein
MKPKRPSVAIAPVKLSKEEQELFSNSLLVRFQDIPIVHFLKAEYFKSVLSECRILLRRADTYPDDTEEASYPELNRSQSSPADTQIEAAFPTVSDRAARMDSQMVARSLSYIHCWYEGDPRSALMWERYGENGKGVCIKSTTRALQAAIGTPPPHLHCEIGRCTYWGENQALPVMISSFPAFRKRRKYDDEEEIRLLARIKPEHIPTDSEGCIKVAPQFEALPVDLQVMVCSVTLGALMDLDTRNELSNMLANILPQEQILTRE